MPSATSSTAEEAHSHRWGVAIASAVRSGFEHNDRDGESVTMVVNPARLGQKQQIRWLSEHVGE
jgi:hypothetical protein